MTPSMNMDEVSTLQTELYLNSQLIDELLQRRTQIQERLASLDPDYSPSKSGTTNSWANVVCKGKRPAQRRTAPIPKHTGIPLQNRLLGLLSQVSPAESPDDGRQYSRAGFHPGSSLADACPSPRAELPGSARPQKARKRPPNTDDSPPASPSSSKRQRVDKANASQQSSTSSEAPGPSTATAREECPALPSDAMQSPHPPHEGNATVVPSAQSFPDDTPNPEYIIIGDSIMRYVKVPNAVRYSYSGAKILDLARHIPLIIERHQLAHTVIVHAGINDVRSPSCSQSKLIQDAYREIANQIEALGKSCIFSGPIPILHSYSERFSRIFGIDQWLQNFCYNNGHLYISHFDSFWNDESLYRKDGLHPNPNGVKVLAGNIARKLSRYFF